MAAPLRDSQAQRPAGWCPRCRGELYGGEGPLCPACRGEEKEREEEKKPK
ncbi:hypothetical protein CE91St41_10380 [Oscillospiraceae bacterium]|nr:hypothetical protein CE91St40_27150 [Oscillospiraceae bacterium]BDF74149.1 hypothetical protein CE91St41_10380 [Oscillospiraceae bacterium]